MLAAFAWFGRPAQAQDPTGPVLQPVPRLMPTPSGSMPRQQGPLYLRADQLSGQPNAEIRADGRVEMRKDGVVLRADQLRYDQAEDLAVAQGKVRITFEGSSFSGPEVQLKVQRMEGFVTAPEYRLATTGAGGRAERIDILGPATSRVINGDYTSCRREGAEQPDWVLSARQLDLDTDAGVGIAEGAVLRFLDVPILSLPRLSFPLSDQRKSGWLPPDLDFTTGSGAELSVPYYWNIAPNRDATLTPAISTRRGLAVNGEFRYLEPAFSGRLNLDLLPYDQVYENTRYWLTFDHAGRIGEDLRYGAHVERASDDDWWNDFPRRHVALTPRLLPLVVLAEKDFGSPQLGAELYARTQRWQVLQAPNIMEAPFDRAAQFGLRSSGNLQAGLQYAFETEANHFVLPSNPGYSAADTPSNGSRLHAQGWINRPFRQPGWWVTPSVLLNAASYYTDETMPDGRTSASRVIPTFSLGGGAEFERSTEWLGRSLRQTLEPRLLYVNTPYVDQSTYPNFDSAVKDYSFASIFSENVFSGIDRVSDTNALTAGVTTRLLDASSGVELLQLGIVQRYLFNDQRVTETGVPENRGYSDVLLRGSTQGAAALQPGRLPALQPERRPGGAHDPRRAVRPWAFPHAEPDLPLCPRHQFAVRGLVAVADLPAGRHAATQGVERQCQQLRWRLVHRRACGLQHHRRPGDRFGGRRRIRRRLLDRAHGGEPLVHGRQRGIDPGAAATRAGRPVAAGLECGQRPEGQYPRLSASARQPQRIPGFGLL